VRDQFFFVRKLYRFRKNLILRGFLAQHPLQLAVRLFNSRALPVFFSRQGDGK
jgi:hypothetical protein